MNRKEKPKTKILTMRLSDETYENFTKRKQEYITWDTFLQTVEDLFEWAENKNKD